MSHIFFKNTNCSHITTEVLASDSFITDYLANGNIKFGYV